MRHLETKREAEERRRVSMMSKGMAEFLERTSRVTEHDLHFSEAKNKRVSGRRKPKVGIRLHESQAEEDMTTDVVKREDEKQHDDSSKTIDKIKLTLDHAASILKESLDLAVGGVVFLDTALGYRQAGVADAYFDEESDLGTATAEQAHHIDSNKDDDDNDNGKQKKVPQEESEKSQSPNHLTPRHVRAYDDNIKPAKVLAMCEAKTAQWAPGTNVIDGKTLQALLNTYPAGNVWYYDRTGYFSSLDQANEKEKESGSGDEDSNDKDDEKQAEEQNADHHDEDKVTAAVKKDATKHDASRKGNDKKQAGKPRRTAGLQVTQQQAEASLLHKVFDGARQIIFIPLWDAANDRWHSGCFVWSKSAVPVFTVDSEIAYIAAFTNSVMVEISRLNAMTSNKMKADFISSISHEFRSPLHGILASAEFLRESSLANTQAEYVATIQNCGSTLLDTINHVLDYSKINSFVQKSSTGAISNELFEVSNVAVLCEDIVNGMIAANEYTSEHVGMSREHSDGILNDGVKPAKQRESHHVAVVLDIETRPWNYRIQSGAVRRVIMNIFGNAQKYAEQGFILVRLRVINSDDTKRENPSLQRKASSNAKSALSITITDSGRGMSSEYMDRKLYQPFAQEDSFATGVGLGLSIVHSIVTQLKGQIEIRSESGKGTEVEVTIPLEHEEDQDGSARDATQAGQEAEEAIKNANAITAAKTFTFLSHTSQPQDSYIVSQFWDCLRRYLVEWFGMKFISVTDIQAAAQADLVVAQHDQDFSGLSPPFSPKRSKLLVVKDSSSWFSGNKSGNSPVVRNDIWTPIGPHKLARVMPSLFRPQKPSFLKDIGRTSSQDSGTQTDLSLATKSTHQSRLAGQASLQVPQPQMTRTITDLSNLTITPPDQVTPVVQRDAISTPPPTITPSQSFLNSPVVPGSAPLRLLAVDDNDLNLQLLARFLKKRKVDLITTACNGLEALNAVKSLSEEHGQNFDVIFMDLTMPVMDGFDSTIRIREYEGACRRSGEQDAKDATATFRKDTQSLDTVLLSGVSDAVSETQTSSTTFAETLRKRTCADGKAYIVALTGLASGRDRDKAIEAGVDDFMTKPVQFGKVGALLKQMSVDKGEKGLGQ